MMSEDYIDRGNDVTSKFLANMLTENTKSQDITPQLLADNFVNGIMENSMLEIEYSGVAEEIVIQDKISDTSPRDNGYKEMNGAREVNESSSSNDDGISNGDCSLKNGITDNLIDGIVSKKQVNGHSSLVYDSNETDTGNSNQDNLLNNSKQDHTYHSFHEHATETDAVDKTSITESTDKPHKCHICGVSFSRQSSLKGHIRLHIEGPDNMLRNTSITVETPVHEKDEFENLYPCILCNERFPCETTLKCHIQSHRDAKSVTIESNDVVNGETESASDDDKREYKCIICEKSFSRRSSLTCHYKNHPYERSPSSKNSNDIDPVEMEVDPEENESKPYRCFKCPKTFARQTGLASHLTLHEINTRKKSNDDSEKRFDIESKISKEVAENDNLNSELVNENIIHEHKCHLCDRSFPQVRGLRQHLLFHRKSTETVAIANHVKTSSIPSDIIYEEVSNRKYTCFTKNHQHDEMMKLYKCNVCQKCFCDIGNLRRHLVRNHRDESTDAENEVFEEDPKLRKRDPATRDICNDRISSKRHKPSTSVAIIFVGLYKCGICNESFDEIGSLGDHVTVHLNDLFRCETCARAFTTNDALECHTCKIPQTSTDEELVCVVCDVKFSNNSTLKRHMNCHRRVEEEIITKVSSSGRRIKDPRSHREDDWNTVPVKRATKANPPEDVQMEKANEGVIMCDCCNRTFPNEKARKIHLYYNSRSTKDKSISPVSKPEPAKPEKQPVAPKQKTELNQKNSNLDSLKCSCCDKLFTSIRALTNHVSGVTDNATEEMSAADNNSMTNMIKCDRCDKFFFGIRALKMHINDHIRKVVPPQESSSADDSTENDEVDETMESQKHEEPEPEELSQTDESQDEIIPYCEICNRTFATNRALGIHKSHHLVCCGKTFETQRAMNIHKSHHTNAASDDFLKCACCDKIFATKQSLKVHLIRKAKHDENIVEEEEHESDDDVFVSLCCDICDQTFKTGQDLKKHRKTHDEENDDSEFECPKCGKIFTSLRSLAVHKAFHTKSEKHHDAEAEAEAEANGKVYFVLANGRFKCRFCDQAFDNVKAVCRHYGKHKKVVEGLDGQALECKALEYKCTICDRSFASGNALGGHMNSHKGTEKPNESGVKEFKCAECDRTFASGKALGGHKRTHKASEESNESEEEPEDVQCSQKAVEKWSESEKEQEEIQCSRCPRTFVNKKALAGHMSFHNTERLPRDKRDSSFSDVSSSKVPKFKNHTQPEGKPTGKVYQCKHCDRTFTNLFGFAGHCSAHKKYGTGKISNGADKSVELSCTLENAAESDSAKTQAKCDICELDFDDLKSLAKHHEEHKADGNLIKSLSGPREFEKEKGLRRQSAVRKNDKHSSNDATSESIADQTVISSIDDSASQFDTIDGTEVESVVDQSTDVTLNETDETIEQTSQKSPQPQASRELQCEICFKQLDNAKALKRHNMWHKFNDFAEEPENTDIHKCTKCDKIFANDQALQVHVTFHGTLANRSMSDLINMVVKCDLCQEFFDCVQLLRKHSLEVHDKVLLTSNAKFRCNFCDKKFHKIIGLRAHLRFHRAVEALPDDVMPFECISCEKCFRLKDDLLEHVKIHMDGDLDDDALQQVDELIRDRIHDSEVAMDEENERSDIVEDESNVEHSNRNTATDAPRDQSVIEHSKRNTPDDACEDESKIEHPNFIISDASHVDESKIEHSNRNTSDNADIDESQIEHLNRISTGAQVDKSKKENSSRNTVDEPKHVLLNHNTNDPPCGTADSTKNEYMICDDVDDVDDFELRIDDVDDFELRIDDENIDSTNDDEVPLSASKINTFSCTVCHKVFRKRCHLATHQRIHSTKSVSSAQKKLKKLPIRATVVLPTRPHKCTLCQLSFRLKSALLEHYQSHETSKPKRALKRHSKFQLSPEEGAQSSKKSLTK